MATIDANIPLQAQAPQVNPISPIENAFTLADLVNKQKAQQQLRQIYSQPDAVDPQTGQLSKNALSQIMQADPQTGMAIQKNQADLAEKQSATSKNLAQIKNYDWQNAAKQQDMIASAGGAIMNQYSTLLKQGKSPQEAQALIQPIWDQEVQKLTATGIIDQAHLGQIPKQFDPNIVANGVFTALGAKGQFEVLHQQNQEALDAQKQQETGRHNRVEEGQGAARVGIEGARLGYEESQPKSEVGKISADYSAGRITEDAYKSSIAKATGSGDPAAIDTVAKGIADGSLPPLTGNSLRTPGGLRTMARVLELNPDYDSKTYGTQAKALKDFSTGKQGNTVRSLNVAMSHLDVLNQAGLALKNGNSTDFNRLAQNLAERTGSPAPTNFNEAKKIVSDEVVKAVVGAGGGVSDREEAAKAFNDANSPAQLAGAIATAKKLLGGQLQGLKKQYETTTGRKDFDKQFLSDEARTLEGPAGGTAPLPGQGPAPAGAAQPPLPAGMAKAPPTTNAQGWTLHKDAKGNMAYVSPDGKQFQQVQ
jgi:hypothetical protein